MAKSLFENRTLPVPLDCPACTARGVDEPDRDDPVPEPVGLVGQPPQGLCGWCGGSGKLSTRVHKLYLEALKGEVAAKMLVETEGKP
ncbi:MAG: hypothetical protein CL819_09000 [Croceicoccus sp.]|nr:hypothetical protein [Croceicoccus sp.]